MKMEQSSETSAYKIQTPENYPEENIQQFFSYFGSNIKPGCTTIRGMKYVHEACRTKAMRILQWQVEGKQLKSVSVNTQRTLSVSSFYNAHLEEGPSLAYSSRPLACSIYLGSSSKNGANLNEQPDDPLCLGDENYPRRLKVISSVRRMTGAPSVGWKFRNFFFSSTQEDANRDHLAKRWDSVRS
jgi:hypothetical protein